MNITVYLGANRGKTNKFETCAFELGKWIAENNHSLVYGGSRSGLMGILADAVLEYGGEVTGVEPQFFIDKGYVHEDITKLITTETMAERRSMMISLGDAFIAFPGGTGTLDEISEVITYTALFQMDAPCILYNIDGYYDGLKDLLQNMIDRGLSSARRLRCVYFANTLEQIGEILDLEDSEKIRHEAKLWAGSESNEVEDVDELITSTKVDTTIINLKNN